MDCDNRWEWFASSTLTELSELQKQAKQVWYLVLSTKHAAGLGNWKMDMPERDKIETALHRPFPTSLASTAAISKSYEVEGGRGRDLDN